MTKFICRGYRRLYWFPYTPHLIKDNPIEIGLHCSALEYLWPNESEYPKSITFYSDPESEPWKELFVKGNQGILVYWDRSMFLSWRLESKGPINVFNVSEEVERWQVRFNLLNQEDK